MVQTNRNELSHLCNHSMEKGLLSLPPKENHFSRWGSGQVWENTWCILFSEHFSICTHFPFLLILHSYHWMQKWGNQAVCSSAWSSYWQIKKLLLYAENPSPIIVVLFMYPKKLLRLNIGWKHKVSHQQSHPLKPIPQCFLSDFLQILKFVKQHRQYILRLPLKHSAYTQNISE